MSDLYESDFHDWAHLQAKLLREGRVTEADLDHIAEEIEDLGNNRRNELRSRLSVLLIHLLKWEYQPGYRSRSWQSTIREQRKRIALHLNDHPSLRSVMSESVDRGYEYALLRADRETGLPDGTFPPTCPYSAEQILDPDFLPGSQ